MNSQLLWSSLQALSSASSPLAIPAAELAGHHRNVALGYMQVFSKFASEICGCATPEDRVKLRKAVFHQTVGLRLKQFEKSPSLLGANVGCIVTISKMECPVSLNRTDESSPSKLILASKVLRSHFQLNEATTCRGCSKRGKCSFGSKVVPTNPGKTSLGALAKVLFGASQLCRQHLANPTLFPLVMTPVEFEAAIKLTTDLTEFLRPSATDRQLANLHVADAKAIRRIIKMQIEKKSVVKKKAKKSLNSDASSEWVEEGVNDGRVPLNFADVEEVAVSPVTTALDDFKAKPVIVREQFKTKVKTCKKIPVQRVPMSDILDRTSNERLQVVASGGYSSDNLASNEGVEYIKPAFLRGKRVLDNVKLASKLFNEKASDLSFLKRVPFESTVLPKEKAIDLTLAQVLQPVAPPGKLTFPKLPQWETPRKTSEKFSAQYASLLRPPR